MKCKNQYGWQEVPTCKQRWMTGSSRSWNPRWLNFLWSYFRQVELSVKFKVKYQAFCRINQFTHICKANVEFKSFYCFQSLNIILFFRPCDLDHVLSGRLLGAQKLLGSWAWLMDHVLSDLGWTCRFTPGHCRHTLSHTHWLFFLIVLF